MTSQSCANCEYFSRTFVQPLKLYTLPIDRLQLETENCKRCFDSEINRCNALKNDLQRLASDGVGDRSLNYTPQQINNQWHICLQRINSSYYKSKEAGIAQLQRIRNQNQLKGGGGGYCTCIRIKQTKNKRNVKRNVK
jgi:hypothetical protein